MHRRNKKKMYAHSSSGWEEGKYLKSNHLKCQEVDSVGPVHIVSGHSLTEMILKKNYLYNFGLPQAII
jgi:hypothetical protein